jgi:hypothetical protein
MSADIFTCGDNACPAGGEHDELADIKFRDADGRVVGGSLACSKCGSTNMDRDLLRLP